MIEHVQFIGLSTEDVLQSCKMLHLLLKKNDEGWRPITKDRNVVIEKCLDFYTLAFLGLFGVVWRAVLTVLTWCESILRKPWKTKRASAWGRTLGDVKTAGLPAQTRHCHIVTLTQDQSPKTRVSCNPQSPQIAKEQPGSMKAAAFLRQKLTLHAFGINLAWTIARPVDIWLLGH